ncbi:MAG: amidohydrolase family protein [Acidobacteria bacterium]|nr:amidohydrolase family protein [Acidobacteriota bacterium]
MKWIDSHVHVWSPDRKAYPRSGALAGIDPLSFKPEELLKLARPCGVARIVLVQMSFYHQDHRFLLESMERYPGVFSGVGLVDPAGPRPAEEMRRLLINGVRGFRISPGAKEDDWLAGAGMKEMWRYAGDRGLAMCPLINPEALPGLARMCGEYRDTTVVIDHFARVGMAAQPDDAALSALCAMARFPRVHVKVSAFYALGHKRPPYLDLVPMIRRVVEAFGVERLMWGSDCPFQVQPPHSYGPSLELVRDHLPFLSAGDREWLLGKTAETVFFPISC